MFVKRVHREVLERPPDPARAQSRLVAGRKLDARPIGRWAFETKAPGGQTNRVIFDFVLLDDVESQQLSWLALCDTLGQMALRIDADLGVADILRAAAGIEGPGKPAAQEP